MSANTNIDNQGKTSVSVDFDPEGYVILGKRTMTSKIKEITKASGGIYAICKLLKKINSCDGDLGIAEKFRSPFYVECFLNTVELLNDVITENTDLLEEKTNCEVQHEQE